jgi:hypothetical protein
MICLITQSELESFDESLRDEQLCIYREVLAGVAMDVRLRYLCGCQWRLYDSWICVKALDGLADVTMWPSDLDRHSDLFRPRNLVRVQRQMVKVCDPICSPRDPGFLALNHVLPLK